MIAFLRLEKVEFAGIKGQALSDMVQKMFAEFQELMTAFAGRSDDPTDIGNATFITDHQAFMKKVADMDQRLAYIMCQAFDDCPSCESVFKVSLQHTYMPLPWIQPCQCASILSKSAIMQGNMNELPPLIKGCDPII